MPEPPPTPGAPPSRWQRVKDSEPVRFLAALARDWSGAHCAHHAAALSFYTILSLVPLLIIALSIAGLVFGDEAARGQVFDTLEEFMGARSATVVQDLLENANQPGAGFLAIVMGSLLLMFGATTVFVHLRIALNHLWEVHAGPRKGFKGLLLARAAAFALVLGVGFLLLVSLLATALLESLGGWLEPRLPGGLGLWSAANLILAFVLVTVAFAAVYLGVPDVQIHFRDALAGGFVTAALFTVGKAIIGVYIGGSRTAGVYGGMATLMIVILWVYYSALIFFAGAVFTKVYARRYGHGDRPQPYAFRVPARIRRSWTR